MLNLIGEFTRECLTIRNGRKLKAVDVIDTHSDLFILRGVPGHISSDNGPEFIAKRSASGLPLSGRGQPTSCPAVLGRMAIARASNSKLRDELLNGEIFYTLEEARVVIEGWRQHYNTVRPHSSLGYKPPAPEAISWPASHPGPASPATPTIAPARGIH
jgi:putative transposase